MVTFEKMPDYQLIELYKSGNNRAFETLLLRHKNYIYSHILSIIKDEDASNDIFQETFIRIITCIKQNNYNDSGKFRYWALRIAHNMVIDHVRASSQSDLVYVDPTDFTYINNEYVYENNREDELIEGQTQKELHLLYRSLPENQKEIIRMRFYENLSFKEISERTGVSINTSLGRMRYAILNMRRLLKEQESA